MHRRSFLRGASAALVLSFPFATAIDLDIGDIDSIKDAAKTIASDLMATYKPTDAPGIWPMPYNWWESGAAWGGMVDYWYLTGDDTYNSVVADALLVQIGPNYNYLPPNQTKTEGNSDQAIWALAALSAAERDFPERSTLSPSSRYISLAQNVFDNFALRWDEKTCDGGLRWQIFPFNQGYNYKNSVSNGAFFQLAARLAQFTGNQTYTDWATRVYEWSETVGLINNGTVFDGADTTSGCKKITKLQWTIDTGLYLYGSAVMYNMTPTATWQKRVTTLLDGAAAFFQVNIMSEVACESNSTCNTDELAYKAFLSRWIARTAVSAPFTADSIMPLIQVSGKAAAKQCSGGSNGTTCGTQWTAGKYDGSMGLGQTLSALEIVQANLIPEAKALANSNTSTSSTSSGNSTNAGGSGGAAASGTTSAKASGTASGTGGPSSTSTTGQTNGVVVTRGNVLSHVLPAALLLTVAMLSLT